MKIKDITSCLESWAPIALQESYDNCGLLVGEPNKEINKALICLDVTEEVLQEAIDSNCDIIIAHHPLIFGGVKKLTGANMVERIILKAIRHDVAIYAIHTNLDNIITGVNGKIADKLGLQDCKILDMKKGILRKLTTFCPDTKLDDGRSAPDAVREALWEAGAGHIGNYDQCSFNYSGTGTYRALEGADPYIGTINELEKTEEIKIEVIYPLYLQNRIIKALWEAHPYEEVAYDIYSLENELQTTGAGIIGKLAEPEDEMGFLKRLKSTMNAACVRHTALKAKKIETVAICGGAGSFLLKNAIAQGADVFITGDFKYHQFFDAEGKIIIADIGHYESEQFTIDLLYDKLNEKFPNFALSKTKVNTNPVKYL